MPRAVYIHIPFCHHICPYCDFNKYVIEGQPVWSYLEALEQEISRTFSNHSAEEIETIFIGGGTPTSLNVEQMRFLLDVIGGIIQPRSNQIEFTIEVNPGTVDEALLEEMQRGSVNRLSFGAQAFDAELLHRLGRNHRVEDIYRSLDLAKSAGFTNLSLDLMFGLPGQTVFQFEKTIEKVLQLHVPHLSVYSLILEEGTLFYRWRDENKLFLPSEDEEADMYAMVIERLCAAGYTHYEISNFALPGFESRHNMTYWHNEEYYGFGAGAHGYVDGLRYENVKGVKQYIQQIAETGRAVREAYRLTKEEAMQETLILGLRLQKGVAGSLFYDRFGVRLEDVYGPELKRLKRQGLLESEGDVYRLTKEGLFLGNEVFAAFI